MNKSKNNSNKNSTLQSAQALSGVFCVIAFLNMTSKYLNIDSNFIISRYGSIMNFENIATEFGNKLGYSTVVLMLLFIIILCKISFIVIKKTHNQECIMYKCCPFVLLMPFLQFFVGYGIGSEILPSFMFLEHLQYGTIGYIVLLVHTILTLFALLFIGLFGAYTIVLTNKRIMTMFPAFQPIEILLSDIKEIQKTINGYKILSKNNVTIDLTFGISKNIIYKKLMILLQEYNRGSNP